MAKLWTIPVTIWMTESDDVVVYVVRRKMPSSWLRVSNFFDGGGLLGISELERTFFVWTSAAPGNSNCQAFVTKQVRDLVVWYFESAERWTGIWCLVELARRSTVRYILHGREMKLWEGGLLNVVAISQTKKQEVQNLCWSRIPTDNLWSRLRTDKDMGVLFENRKTKAVWNGDNFELWQVGRSNLSLTAPLPNINYERKFSWY